MQIYPHLVLGVDDSKTIECGYEKMTEDKISADFLESSGWKNLLARKDPRYLVCCYAEIYTDPR